jgi:hypothetical protein
MTMTVSAADVLQAGLTIEPEEAVAIAQGLIATLRAGVCADVVEPPFGPPTPERVMLCDDGSVVCRGCETTPAVSEVAMLLQSLLPPAPARVPGGLRYTIARALLDVDVAPFDSLDELSETLARYERGPRDQMVIGVLQRFAASRGLVPVSIVERRRHVRTTELRRALREADARLYLHKVAAEAVIVAPVPPRHRMLPTVAACVCAGVLLVLSGEVMHHVWHDPVPLPSPAVLAPVAAPVGTPAAVSAIGTNTAPDGSGVARSAVIVDTRRNDAVGSASAVRVRSTPKRTPARSSGESKATVIKRTSRPTPRVHPQPSPRTIGRDGVLDRLRLRWLRGMFAHADL